MQKPLIVKLSGGGQSNLSFITALFRRIRSSNNRGFTLAEVLITISIIGIVAALTIPGLVAKYQKQVTMTKVYKFYSMINQAVRIATIEHGEPDVWIYPGGIEMGNNTTITVNYKNNLEFVNKYFRPYIKVLSCENWKLGSSAQDAAAIMCHFPSGDAIVLGVYQGGASGINNISVDIYYISDFKRSQLTSGKYLTDPRRVFYFSMQKESDNGTEKDHIANTNVKNKNFVVPYVLNWDGTIEGLTKRGTKYSCSSGYTFYPAYCTKLLELNNWKVPDEYPW